MRNRALVVIDVQNDYFEGGACELDHPRETAEVIGRLIRQFRKKNQPVVYIQHVADKSSGAMAEGSFGVQIHDAVAPIEGEPVLIKHVPNSFHETGLRELLQEKGIKELVICGMMSHMCVDTTTRAGFDLGFSITVAQDACTTMPLTWNGVTVPASIVHQVSMAALADGFAKVESSEQVLKEE